MHIVLLIPAFITRFPAVLMISCVTTVVASPLNLYLSPLLPLTSYPLPFCSLVGKWKALWPFSYQIPVQLIQEIAVIFLATA